MFPDSFIADAPPKYLRLVADYFMRQASTLLERAAEIEHGRRPDIEATRRNAELFRSMVGACRQLSRQVSAGVPFTIAAAQIAAEHAVYPATLMAHWKLYRREREETRRAWRTRQIVRLSKTGATDAQVAIAVRLHPKTVARLRRAACGNLAGPSDGRPDSRRAVELVDASFRA